MPKLLLLTMSINFIMPTEGLICEHEKPFNTICSENELSLLSETNHEKADGLKYYWGYNNEKASDKESGYIYFDFDSYYQEFTNISRLYLLNIKVKFTSGYIACQNKESGYSDMFELDKGFVHVAAFNNFKDKNDTSSSVKLLASWPDSSKSTSTISSAYSVNYSSNWDNYSELSWPAGVKASVSKSNGLSITIDHSTTITTDEPVVSTQTSPKNNLEQQWNYQYKALGKATYTLDTYYLLEVKNDAIGFDTYGFVFDLYINMSNVQWKNWWWESHDEHDYSLRTYLGLGRNPGK